MVAQQATRVQDILDSVPSTVNKTPAPKYTFTVDANVCFLNILDFALIDAWDTDLAGGWGWGGAVLPDMQVYRAPAASEPQPGSACSPLYTSSLAVSRAHSPHLAQLHLESQNQLTRALCLI